MAAHRTVRAAAAAAVAVGLTPLVFTALAATPAGAHGAMSTPVSRAAACGLQTQQYGQSAACKAATALSGNLADWDNIRVANVNGRDREVIPDGKLCSGGVDRFKGLDLARADWPSTRLTAGANLTFGYRETIAHKGTFRVYVTKDGFSPTRALRWSDLDATPFLTVTDPPRQNGAYVIRGRLPRAKTGQHMIYTIWQNSSTPDTYYSCSDVVFADPAAAPGSAATSPPAASPPAGSPPITSPTRELSNGEPSNGQAPAGTGVGSADPVPVQVARRGGQSAAPERADRTLALAAGGTALAVTLAAAVTLVVRRRRQRL